MARIFFNNTGASDASLNAGDNVITFSGTAAISSGMLLLTNDADSAIVGRINAESNVTLNGAAAGEDFDFRMDAKSFQLIPFTVTAGGTAATRRVDISESHIFTAHRTSANSGEHVYLTRAI